jgi:phosphoglycerate dehydrogenase-like enzyme
MLAAARQLPAALRDQVQSRRWAYADLRPASRILEGQSVLILGHGAIARRLVELLAPFDLDVRVFRRHPDGTESVPVVTDLHASLGETDFVINALPLNDSTQGLYGADAIAATRPGAIVCNVGRGATIDQAALVRALESGHLGGAYLDVTDPEPLPTDHPLWSLGNVLITPHTAGGCQDEDVRLASHFLANLHRFTRGEALADRIA